MSENNINLIDYKEEENFCNLISNFRTSLGQLNTFFIDLIKYNNEYKEKCSKIAKINNNFIKRFILPDGNVEKLLTHENSIYLIEEYLDNKTSEAPRLLNEINKEVKKQFDAFLSSPESPYNVENTKSTAVNKKLDKYKQSLNDDTKYQPRVIDDYFDDISSIFENCFGSDDDDDDDDNFSRNDRRFYKNPHPYIPKVVQKSVDQFMTYINIQIIIKNLLNYDNTINKCYDKLGKTRVTKTIDPEMFAKLLNENQLLKNQIKEIKDEKTYLANDNKRKDKQIRSLEDQCQKYEDKIRELERINKDLSTPKPESTKIKSLAPKLDLKDDDKFLNAISYFRTSIDNMNTSFMDLVKYDNYFIGDCKSIYNTNKQFIRDLVVDNSSDLGHFSRLLNIYQYYLKKNEISNRKENICKHLIILKQKIKIQLNICRDDIMESISKDKTLTDKKINIIQKRLKDAEESINKLKFNSASEIDLYTDFISEKIEPIYKSKNENSDDDDDDNNDDDEHEKRYYGNPYPNIPESVQYNISHFLALLNSLISISSVLEFNKYVDVQVGKVSNIISKQQITSKNEYLVQLKEMAECRIDAEKYELLLTIVKRKENLSLSKDDDDNYGLYFSTPSFNI